MIQKFVAQPSEAAGAREQLLYLPTRRLHRRRHCSPNGCSCLGFFCRFQLLPQMARRISLGAPSRTLQRGKRFCPETFSVCFGPLSCCRGPDLQLRPRFLTPDSTFRSSPVPEQVWDVVVPCTAKQPRGRHFTAGTVFFSWKA